MRDHNLKIPDIKHVRRITSFLGKLGIDECRSRNDPAPHPYLPAYSDNWPEWRYGWGLAETKRYVENKYHYVHIKGSPLDMFQKNNQLHEIKRTRQLMFMLSKLGIKNTDSSLRAGKDFVTRMRARN